MWKRNLLFGGVCLFAFAAIMGGMRRATVPANWALANSQAGSQDDFRQAVLKVDAAFAARWAAKDLTPAPPTEELAVARRLSLALTGVIPSLEEVRMFQQQPQEGRLDWWITGLLADKRSSDYLAERLARSYVGVMDGPFVVYRRRRFVSWLSEQLHANRPYDALVRELIASDGLWTNTPQVNFITAAIKPDSDVGVQENVMATRVARAFLGIRLDCAECHDHPFDDRWKQGHFEQLAAFFGQTENSLRGVREAKLEPGKPVYQVQDRSTLEMRDVSPVPPFLPELCPSDGNARQRLAGWVTHRDNRMFARAIVNRSWGLLFGRPMIEPIDSVPTNEAEIPPALQVLADDLVAHDFDLHRLLRLIAASRAFRLDSCADSALPGHEITKEHEDEFAAFPITRLRSEQVVGAVLQSSALHTIDYESHVLVRFARATQQNDFVKQYGDAGEDEFNDRGGTIPQRLLMMNGSLVKERTKTDVFTASNRIARLAADPTEAVEIAYLTVLTRLPSDEERAHFVARLTAAPESERPQLLEDLCWTLVNSTEFSWNH